MEATVRRYEGITDPAQVGRRVAEEFVPLLKEIPGFVSYYWADAGGGVMVSMSVFQDRSSADTSNERAAAWVADTAAELFPNPPQITVGTVVAHG
jgi:hypothetical protein